MKKIGSILILWIIATLLVVSIKVIPEFKEQWSLVIAMFWVVAYVLVIIYIIRVWIKTNSIDKENRKTKEDPKN